MVEIAVRVAETGEVEAQHGDPGLGEGTGYSRGRDHILVTGKAVREQRVAAGRAVGQLERRGQSGTP